MEKPAEDNKEVEAEQVDETKGEVIPPISKASNIKATTEDNPNQEVSLATLEDIPEEEAIHIQQIEGAESLNLVLKNFDEYVSEWKTLTAPILKKRDECFKLCDIEEEKMANIKHVVIGTLIAYMVNGATVESVKKQVKFLKAAPFIEVDPSMDEKYRNIINLTRDWIMEYI